MPDESLDQLFEDSLRWFVNLSKVEKVPVEADEGVAELVRLISLYRSRAAYWEARATVLRESVDLLTARLAAVEGQQAEIMKVLVACFASAVRVGRSAASPEVGSRLVRDLAEFCGVTTS